MNPPLENVKTGIYIKRLREYLGLTQLELAEKFNGHRHHISNLERDKNSITLGRFILICKAVNFTNFNLILNDKTWTKWKEKNKNN